MRATRANFGEWVSIYPHIDGVLFDLDRTFWYLDDEPRKAENTHLSPAVSPNGPGPFARADFGSCDRLAWPVGACAMPQQAQLTYWAERFAMWQDGQTRLAIVDATRAMIVRVELPFLGVRYSWHQKPLVHVGRLWLPCSDDVVWFELSALEALFDAPSGPLAIEVRELYPRLRKHHAVRARVEAIVKDKIRLRTIDDLRSTDLAPIPGLAVGMEVTLHDELMRDVFLEIELPGQPRRSIHAPVAPTSSVIGRVEHEPAVDPAGSLVKPVDAPARQADLDRLFAARADEPDDIATGLVIVDSLEEAGEPYAPKLGALIAGETTDGARRDALGPLASYLLRIGYRGGLPWSAELASTAPRDDDIGNLVATDQRLGLFHTLRLGEGDYGVYAKLVGAPRAVGLRHVDAARHQILRALIEAKRRDLVRLSSVKFATREVLEALADTTFDRVREIETETGAAQVAKLLEFVIRDELAFFARSPRHLVLRERTGDDDTLVAPVLAMWDRLPLAMITIAGITLSRDGTAHADDMASPQAVALVRERFRINEAARS